MAWVWAADSLAHEITELVVETSFAFRRRLWSNRVDDAVKDASDDARCRRHAFDMDKVCWIRVVE